MKRKMKKMLREAKKNGNSEYYDSICLLDFLQNQITDALDTFVMESRSPKYRFLNKPALEKDVENIKIQITAIFEILSSSHYKKGGTL